MLNKLTVNGFKSIESCELELQRLNVVIGPNGAGKSNLLSLFRLLRALAQGNLGLFVGEAGGAGSLLHLGPPRAAGIVLTLDWQDASLTLGLLAADNDRLIFDRESVLLPDAAPYALASRGSLEAALASTTDAAPGRLRARLAALRVHHFHDTSASSGIRRSTSLHDNRWLREGGENLAACLLLMRDTAPEHYRRIVEVIRLAVPAFGDFDFKPHPKAETVLLNWRHRHADEVLGPHQLSDGSLRFMALATLLLQPVLPELVILDEPEIGLHPQAIGLLAEWLKLAAQQTQLLVATQSPLLVDCLTAEDVLVIDCPDGRTRLRRLNAPELAEWLTDYTLGELWHMNVLGGNL